jgi:hypothetical protein
MIRTDGGKACWGDPGNLTRICEFARRLHQLHRVGDDEAIDSGMARKRGGRDPSISQGRTYVPPCLAATVSMAAVWTVHLRLVTRTIDRAGTIVESPKPEIRRTGALPFSRPIGRLHSVFD